MVDTHVGHKAVLRMLQTEISATIAPDAGESACNGDDILNKTNYVMSQPTCKTLPLLGPTMPHAYVP